MITGCRYPEGNPFDRYHKAVLWRNLNLLTKQLGITKIIVGCAQGVDAYTVEWCKRTGMSFEIYSADWKVYGKGAGHIRNSEMLCDSDIVVAFWDKLSKGTLDAIKKSEGVKKLCTIIQIHLWRGPKHYTRSTQVR